ncbi:MAG: cytoplasmic protein [Acidobacteria bacterium]|nr:MAG: cytoplasmic protein [Acidobacteriota bacterium]
MKNLRRVIPGVLCLTVAWCLVAATPRAQDPTQAAASNFKVLLENDRVRVLDFHGKAGEKIAMHSHPAYISYQVSGSGKTTFTSPDGKTTEREARPGQALWHEAETHSSESSGAVHALLIELKK